MTSHLTEITLTLAMTVSSAAFAADSRIDAMCGSAHGNEAASPNDIRENPDGYYIESLNQQIRHGDPRIVVTTAEPFHLCTRSAARPDMDEARAAALMGEREVKWLFVPAVRDCPKPAS